MKQNCQSGGWPWTNPQMQMGLPTGNRNKMKTKTNRCIFTLLEGTLIQIWKSAHYFLFSYKNTMLKISLLKYLSFFKICAREICENFVYKHSVSPRKNVNYSLFLEFLALTHFSPQHRFSTPWKRHKTFDFLTFSEGIKMGDWAKIV